MIFTYGHNSITFSNFIIIIAQRLKKNLFQKQWWHANSSENNVKKRDRDFEENIN